MHFVREMKRGDDDWTLTVTEEDGVISTNTVTGLPPDIIDLFDALSTPLRSLTEHPLLTIESYKMTSKKSIEYITFKATARLGGFYGEVTLKNIWFEKRYLELMDRETLAELAEYQKAETINEMIELCQKISYEVRDRYLEIIKMKGDQLELFGRGSKMTFGPMAN